jgi:hypothetical protein
MKQAQLLLADHTQLRLVPCTCPAASFALLQVHNLRGSRTQCTHQLVVSRRRLLPCDTLVVGMPACTPPWCPAVNDSAVHI